MKRILLICILLFPLATLCFWLTWGYTRPRITSNLPLATNATINATTNQSSPAKP